jgi:hypothetical protein
MTTHPYTVDILTDEGPGSIVWSTKASYEIEASTPEQAFQKAIGLATRDCVKFDAATVSRSNKNDPVLYCIDNDFWT